MYCQKYCDTDVSAVGEELNLCITLHAEIEPAREPAKGPEDQILVQMQVDVLQDLSIPVR